MIHFDCPYLSEQVELTDERQDHIALRHPDLLPDHLDAIAATLAEPDLIRRSHRFPNALQFSRWFETVHRGKHVVVIVVSGNGYGERHWIITAYLSRRISGGEIEWQSD